MRAARTDQLSLLRMAEVDWAEVDTLAGADHPGYRLVSWQDACPDELLESFAGAKHAMNDAPTGDMEVADRRGRRSSSGTGNESAASEVASSG